MNGIGQLKKRTEKLAPSGGNVVLIYTDQPDQITERVNAERARGNIPIILPEEDRDL